MTCPHENAHVGSKLPNGGWEHICNHCHAVIGDSISGRYVAAPTPPASQPTVTLDRETLAQKFHEAYERLASQFGYRTREASAVPWADVPKQNKQLMIAVAGEVLALLRAAERHQP